MRLFMYLYNPASQGGRELSGLLNAPRIKKENSKFRGAGDRVVINWGSAGRLSDEINKSVVLNDPGRVRAASNKLSFFELMADHVSTPPFTTNKEEALAWYNERRCTVFARTVLNGHSGEGIVELNKPEDFENIEDGVLLVKYIPKKEEYRLHCTALDGVIDIQRKARRFEADNPNWRIRNHGNGFVYARGDVRSTPQCVKDVALAAFERSGLDFGGVDVIYNKKQDSAYVLEINTAPGLEGTTIRRYATYLYRLAQHRTGEHVEPEQIVEDEDVRPTGSRVGTIRWTRRPALVEDIDDNF